jgi:hypothetical protein
LSYLGVSKTGEREECEGIEVRGIYPNLRTMIMFNYAKTVSTLPKPITDLLGITTKTALLEEIKELPLGADADDTSSSYLNEDQMKVVDPLLLKTATEVSGKSFSLPRGIIGEEERTFKSIVFDEIDEEAGIIERFRR